MTYTGTRYPRPARRPAFKERLWVRGTNGRIANWNGANVDRQSTYFAPLLINDFGTYQSTNNVFDSAVGNPTIRLRPDSLDGNLIIRFKFADASNKNPFLAHYEGIIINGYYSPITDWRASTSSNQIDYIGSDPSFINGATRHTDRVWVSFVNSIP